MPKVAAGREPDDADEGDERRYRAPALEKGLDVLELLAREPDPMTLTGIVQRLGRSHGELFRMIQVLEFRGYIEQDPESDGYRLTDRLFSLGLGQPRTRHLVEAALPIMRKLAFELGQSCHLAMHSSGEIVVVARMESSEQIGFSVRVGYRRPLTSAASGLVLFAHQPLDVQARWLRALASPLSPEAEAEFRIRAQQVRADGFVKTPSNYVSGVTDFSAPILRGGQAAAALTVPYLPSIQPRVPKGSVPKYVREAAAAISAHLVEGDSRA
jgi:DNA-binding IclR family transcriptional regulator